MNLRFIPTKAHGIMDYAMSSAKTGAPWIFGFNNKKGAESIVPMISAVGTTAQSLLTNFELGASKKIPMKTHLMVDVLCGAFLAASPWLFNMPKEARAPLAALGLLEMGAGLMTRLEPATVPAKSNRSL